VSARQVGRDDLRRERQKSNPETPKLPGNADFFALPHGETAENWALTAAQLRQQIHNGPPAKCFRPPYGATNKAVRRAIRQAGARQVLSSVDALDWAEPGTKRLEQIGSSKQVTAGSIILMHDGGGTREQTVAALPQLIHNLQARGYQVRALPHCS